MSGKYQSSLWTTIGVGAAVAGLTVAQPLTTVAAPVVMATLVVEAGSTHLSGQGIPELFGGKFNPGQPIYVSFLTGPFGVWPGQ